MKYSFYEYVKRYCKNIDNSKDLSEDMRIDANSHEFDANSLTAYEWLHRIQFTVGACREAVITAYLCLRKYRKYGGDCGCRFYRRKK